MLREQTERGVEGATFEMMMRRGQPILFLRKVIGSAVMESIAIATVEYVIVILAHQVVAVRQRSSCAYAVITSSCRRAYISTS